MSLSLAPDITPVKVQDPILNIDQSKYYTILEGPKQNTYQVFVANSSSNSSANWNINPPNINVLTNRKWFIRYYCQLDFTGADQGSPLLQLGVNDAPRAWPVSSCISSANLQINNGGVNINLSDVISGLYRYNCGTDYRQYDLSILPAMPDQFQDYNTGSATNRDPLAAYGANPAEMSRGAFTIQVISNTNTAASIRFISTEPLILPPLNWAHGDSPGFLGVNQFVVTLNFSNLSYMWSHSSAGLTLSTVAGSFYQNPEVLVNFLTPPDTMPLPKMIPYSYYVINRYQTDFGNVNAGASFTVNSNNITLQSVPERIFVYARRRNADRTFLTTDCYAALQSIAINWNNQNNILSTASAQSLYEIAVKNGCNLSYEQWSNFTGSVLALDFAKDIALDSSIISPGQNGSFQLQIQATFTNTSANTVNYTFYIITVSEGIFTVDSGFAVPQIGVVSASDSLNTPEVEAVPYEEIEAAAGAGNFFSKLKKFARKAYKVGKKIAPHIEKGIETAERLAPLLAAAAGKDKKKGGVLVGGRMMSRKMLKDRM